MILRASVTGPPPSMGSKRAFVNRATGRAVLVDHNAKSLRQWQDAMRSGMRVEVGLFGVHLVPDEWPEFMGPWFAAIMVRLLRPRSHFTIKGQLRKSAPIHPIVKPDIDKIARAVLDCGSGVWWRDDNQIVACTIIKRYVERDPDVSILASPIPNGMNPFVFLRHVEDISPDFLPTPDLALGL